MTAAESKRLARQLAEAENELARTNQNKGRPPGAEKMAEKERRKIELQEAIASLTQQIEKCKVLLAKLKI